jgi:metal-dependent amidase/aminoacylase/carboxypeptidase family protein
MELFHEGSGTAGPRHLDLRVWFTTLRVTTRAGEQLPLQEFIDGGTRWWNGLHEGDPRTGGKGIVSGVHTPTFDIDEEALEIGPGLMAYLAFKDLL